MHFLEEDAARKQSKGSRAYLSRGFKDNEKPPRRLVLKRQKHNLDKLEHVPQPWIDFQVRLWCIVWTVAAWAREYLLINTQERGHSVQRLQEKWFNACTLHTLHVRVRAPRCT
jgi:hypothetical protein